MIESLYVAIVADDAAPPSWRRQTVVCSPRRLVTPFNFFLKGDNSAFLESKSECVAGMGETHLSM